VLNSRKPDIRVVAAKPEASPVLSGGSLLSFDLPARADPAYG
jgi:cysteine synthase